ncbi:MAG TPA: polysaccharide biosynthesis/export family protein [Opitutaceae bacterium]|nr:polysaccharide biosynthesis/export family protein [Opitutaceae bacterium]
MTSPVIHPLACLAFCLATLCLTAGLADAAPNLDQPAAKDSAYKLHAMDLIKLQVFHEPELDRELRVSQDNTIKLPLIGNVSVSNLSVRETEHLIAGLYGEDYLVNPQINITVLEYSPRSVNVFGSVNQPGAVLFPPEKSLTLLDAIARSGGFSRLANRSKVSLTRTEPDGRSINYTVNADQLVGGDTDQRVQIQDGDVIFVPERLL